MSAPKETSSSPTISSPINPGVSLKKIAQLVSVAQWFTLAAAIMVFSTALLFLQRPWRHANAYPLTAKSWWLYSIEWNSLRGLPEIIGNLNAVAIQTGGPRVFIAGDHGLLAYSEDLGDCWTRLAYDAHVGSFSVAEPRCNTSKDAALPPIQWSLRVEADTSKPQSKPNQQNNSQVQQNAPAPPPQGAKPTVAQTSQVKIVNVPDVRGQPPDVAEKMLDSVGLRRGDITWQLSATGIGNIIAQSPNAGEQVVPGTAVNITVEAKSAPAPALRLQTIVPRPNNEIGATIKKTVPVTSPVATPISANLPPPNLLDIEIAKDSGTIHASDGGVFTSVDGGEDWKGTLLTAQLNSLNASSPSDQKSFAYKYVMGPNGIPPGMVYRSGWQVKPGVGCVAGSDSMGGAVQCTRDGGKTWPSQQRTGKDGLEGVTFTEDGSVGWVVGANGVVLWTGDGGEHWQAKTQSAAIDMGASQHGKDWWRWLPPWFYAAWTVSLLCAAIAPFAQVEPSSVAFIQDYAASDKPLERGDNDALDFTPLAKSLSAFVRNSATKPPLTISIDGPWGSGKSSLMNLMCADLREFGFRAIWFNAWHNQKEQHLLAALLQTVRSDAVPRLWDPSGIGFRCRLIGYRLQRYWFPMLLVTGAAVFLFAFDYYHAGKSGHSLLVDLPRLLPRWLGGTGKEGGGLFAALNNWPSLGTLLSLVALSPVVKKLLQAFGTNPAALLAVVSKGNRISDLDAEISFREKFAKEFRDVTQALGDDRQLVVFIDDLDRCRPENVRDVLEAVNFLVSSGECFVVMGLERKSVVAAVGLSLKDMAAEMYGKPMKEDDPELVAARHQYAGNFLDKLINLEVPIPQLDPNKARGLFYASGPNAISNDAKTEAEFRKRAWEKQAQQFAHFTLSGARFLIAFLMSVTLVWGAFKAGLWIDDHERVQVAASANASSTTASNTNATAGAPTIVNTNETAKGEAPPARGASSAPAPKIDQGSSPRPALWLLSWPEFAAFVLLATLVYYTLVGATKGASHDSLRFIDALEIWYPVVIARQPTPRAVKRWMNRVRYLATRELPSSELRSPIERFAESYAARRAAKDGLSEDMPAGEAAEPSGKIPEEIAVALAAIYEFDPEILKGVTNFACLLDVDESSGISEKGSVNQMICERRALHVEKLGRKSWDQINIFAKRFLALWPTIDIR